LLTPAKKKGKKGPHYQQEKAKRGEGPFPAQKMKGSEGIVPPSPNGEKGRCCFASGLFTATNEKKKGPPA